MITEETKAEILNDLDTAKNDYLSKQLPIVWRRMAISNPFVKAELKMAIESAYYVAFSEGLSAGAKAVKSSIAWDITRRKEATKGANT